MVRGIPREKLPGTSRCLQNPLESPKTHPFPAIPPFPNHRGRIRYIVETMWAAIAPCLDHDVQHAHIKT